MLTANGTRSVPLESGTNSGSEQGSYGLLSASTCLNLPQSASPDINAALNSCIVAS